MSAELRMDQCCVAVGCKRPAQFGDLCAACFYSATPARRAAELLGSGDTAPLDSLELIYGLPSYGEAA